MQSNHYTLVNPANGNLAFKIMSFDGGSFDHIQRLGYYSVIWLRKGSGVLKSGFSEFVVEENSMMFFAPYEPFMLSSTEPIEGVSLHFHSDFFCIYHHDQGIGCNGLLFNNVYEHPCITVPKDAEPKFVQVIDQMMDELRNTAVWQYDFLATLLKVFLIQAVRVKSLQAPKEITEVKGKRSPVLLRQLIQLIEENYKKERQPAFYASLLFITPKALGKLAKQYFDKTLTDIIAERVIVEAKRELYLTTKPVKTIAYELGFEDEFHFSRYFKNHTDVSPQLFRDTVGNTAMQNLYN